MTARRRRALHEGVTHDGARKDRPDARKAGKPCPAQGPNAVCARVTAVFARVTAVFARVTAVFARARG